MKKNLIAVLIFAVSSSPILACTTMPPANTTKSSDRVVEVQDETMIQVVSAVTSKRKGEPSQLPAPKPEQLPEEEKPEQLPEEKPEQLPEEKPEQLPEEKPEQLPEEKPEQLPEEEKPAQLPEQGKPDQAPETEKPTQLPEQGKPSQKPCKKPEKPAQLPEKGFVIDNFKIIQKALQKLGCTPEELEVMIKDGKKLIDVLEAKDIPIKKFRKALYKEYCSVIKEAVKEDKITHQEGKMLKAAIKEKVNSWMKDKE